MSYEIVKGSLGPVFPLTLTEDADGFVLELTDVIKLRYVDPDGEVHEVTMEITNAGSGEIEYTWVDGDLPSVGIYKGQVTVERVDDTFPRTFPSDGSPIIWWVHTKI